MKKKVINTLLGFFGVSAFALLCGINVDGMNAAPALLTVAGLLAIVAGCALIARHTAPEMFDPSDRV